MHEALLVSQVRVGCYWHPAGGGKGCCSPSCRAQNGPQQMIVWPKVSVMPLEHSGLWETSQHLASLDSDCSILGGKFTHLLEFTPSFPLAKVKPFAPVRTFDPSSVESVDQAGGAPLVRVGAHSWRQRGSSFEASSSGLSQGPAPDFLSLVFFFLKTLCLHPMALWARRLWPQWAVPAPGEGVFQEGLPAQGCAATSLEQQTRQAQKGGRQALLEADERVSGRGAWLWSLLHLCHLALSSQPWQPLQSQRCG